MISGGAPANSMNLIKYEQMLLEKATNPFKTNDALPEKTRELELANVGPGMYSPIKNEIGGNPLDREKLKYL